jgi:hypothetical protein
MTESVIDELAARRRLRAIRRLHRKLTRACPRIWVGQFELDYLSCATAAQSVKRRDHNDRAAIRPVAPELAGAAQ